VRKLTAPARPSLPNWVEAGPPHLHRLDAVHVEVVAAPGGEGAEREAVGQADAIDQHQHLVALQPADVDALVACPPGGGTGGGEARGAARTVVELVAEHVLDVARPRARSARP
jgi:hypothetical protein